MIVWNPWQYTGVYVGGVCRIIWVTLVKIVNGEITDFPADIYLLKRGKAGQSVKYAHS